MESLPELPGSQNLRAFVIWSTAGLLAVALGLGAAAMRKSWPEVQRAAYPFGAIILGVAVGQIAPKAHIWSMWAAVVLGIWAAHKNSGLSSFLIFVGTLGLAAASFMARSLF